MLQKNQTCKEDKLFFFDSNKCKIKNKLFKKKAKEMKTKNNVIEALVKKCKELKHHAMFTKKKHKEQYCINTK